VNTIQVKKNRWDEIPKVRLRLAKWRCRFISQSLSEAENELTLTLKMNEKLTLRVKANPFIFNRQHEVQKSPMTFLG
jgi:hypothetical protein